MSHQLYKPADSFRLSFLNRIFLAGTLTPVASLCWGVSKVLYQPVSLEPILPTLPTNRAQLIALHLGERALLTNTAVGKIRQFLLVSARAISLFIRFLPPLLFGTVAWLFPSLAPRFWSFLKSSLESGGCCWIKLGQWISTRPDVFPTALCSELESFHSACPTHSWAESQAILEAELNMPVEVMFREIDKTPIASGAVAQVYKAVYRASGKVVAVKVQHPNVEKLVIEDLYIMKFVANLLNRLPLFKWYSLPDSAAQFEVTMIQQVHLDIEAHNLEKFASNFQSVPSISFPRVEPSAVTSRVLVESFEEGTPLIEYINRAPNDKTRLRVADLALDAYLKMMLMNNFVHSDLHPGNILVREGPSGPKLVLLDCGLVTELSPELRKLFLDLFVNIVRGDGEEAAAAMIRVFVFSLIFQGSYTEIAPEEIASFKKEMASLFARLHSNKLSDARIGETLTSVLNTLRKYRVKLEGNFASLVVSTVLLEGVAKQLNPDLTLIALAKPFLKALATQ